MKGCVFSARFASLWGTSCEMQRHAVQDCSRTGGLVAACFCLVRDCCTAFAFCFFLRGVWQSLITTVSLKPTAISCGLNTRSSPWTSITMYFWSKQRLKVVLPVRVPFVPYTGITGFTRGFDVVLCRRGRKQLKHQSLFVLLHERVRRESFRCGQQQNGSAV